MKQIISHIAICLLLASTVTAQEQTAVLSLDSIISRIDRNNIALQAWDLEAKSYRHRADAATAWMSPMVGAGTFMTPYPGAKIMEARDRGNVMLEVEQEIPNPAKLKAKRDFILSQGDVVAAGRSVNLNDLRYQAKVNYYTWLIADEKIALLKQNERLANTMKKVEEVRYPYNQAKLSGVFTITAKLEENNNMIAMQEGVIRRSRATLLALMNEDAGLLFAIDTNVDAHYVPALVGDTSVIADARADVNQMNERIRSMQMNISTMLQERKPNFRVRFDHMTPLSNMMPNSFSIMGMISIPIVPWASRMYKSEIKAMELSVQGMRKQREGMLQETMGMLNGMQSEIQIMHDRVISMEEKIVPALQKALDANYLLYQENKLELREVFDSWEALNMMQMNLLDEKLKHFQMIAEYEKLLYQ